MSNNGTWAVSAIIVILMIASIISIGLGGYVIYESTGDGGYIGIICGVVGLIAAGFLQGFRTIVEAASLYIERNKMI